ncbi:hypothetical protein [Lactiplantibacillus plantarum]|uniref:hypothetical protein n=1 Tax=Lactiplantibacillus plantarum TaxID=1590 RepID=UPI00024F3B38|nr:hypothetical protein [Lactiplantibacillus plantarum]EHS83408.1 hypothetical protein nc8_0814 [Lactiplantibacillus plantarum subsp. plantarum NC8]KFL89216.1 hypothetical protein LpDm1_1596 [Lactiplantibacillus plantarum]KZU16636.1 hypothetical protein CNW10_1540 [Lactiplantibacillus plantarum]
MVLTKSFFEKEETSFLKWYEIKLRNKMNTAFIARETARLIEEKVKVHQLGPNQNALDELLIENEADIEGNVVVPSMFKFTSDGLGLTESNNVSSMTGIIGEPNHLAGLKADLTLSGMTLKSQKK